VNSDHEIYEAAEKDIPPEDKARLDGYLKGRAEADMRARVEELQAALEASK
jgi:hypothetical protein